MPTFKVSGSDDLRDLAADLKRAGHVELRKSMQKHLREAIKPIVPELRAAILGLPSSGKGHTGLRSSIARGVQAKVSVAGPRVGVRLRVDPRLLAGSAKSLPKRLDGIGRWRHPVFGHDRWVTQPSHPYFYRTLLPHKDRVQAEVRKVLDDTSKAAGFH